MLSNDEERVYNSQEQTTFEEQNVYDYTLDTINEMLPNENNEETMKVNVSSLHDLKGRVPCDKCTYVANAPSLLKIHKDAVHEGVRYPCDQCEYKATQRVNLKRHMLKHTK